jgi:hypothetical protein
VSDGCQPLNIRAEDPLEGPRLGLTQLGKLGGDVRNGAVVLAQLHARAGVLGACSVSLARQRHGKGFDAPFPSHFSCLEGHRRGDRGLEGARSMSGELGDGILAAGLSQVTQGRRGQVVIGVRERRSPGIG